MFVILWIQKSGATPEYAKNRGHMMTGIAYSFGLISALVFGFYFDRKRVSTVKLKLIYLVTHNMQCVNYLRL
jgi:hypothetical protein